MEGAAVTEVGSESAGGAKGTVKSAAATGSESAGVTKSAVKSTAAGKGAGVTKSASEDTAVGEAVGKKTVGKDAAVEEGVATEAGVPQGDAGQGTSGKKTPTKRAAGKSTAHKAGAAKAAKQTGATTVVAKKTPGTATAAKTALPNARVAAVEPGELAVRPGEDPWTPQEVEEARAELTAEAHRLRTEISASEESLVGLMRDSGDGAGDDQADTGTKNITRESEMALAANAREMLLQTERALGRLDAGTYGLCENCGNPIGKARMQAFPRATLCVECKQKQERRY
jgi:RNA polymerase-binding protein DksA